MLRIPKDGIERPTFATETARNWSLLVWPMYRPRGMAIAAAIATATREISTCWNVRTGIPSNPDQWDPSTSHLRAWTNVCIRGPLWNRRRSRRDERPEAYAAPGGQGPPRAQEQRVCNQGEDQGGQGTSEDLGGVQEPQALHDELAQPALS